EANERSNADMPGSVSSLQRSRRTAMPSAARAFDTAQPSQGGDRGEASAGSPDVIIDNRAALRAGDGGQGFHTTDGSAGVFIDGLPAIRQGDPTDHKGTQGEVLQGSPDVIIGSRAGA